MTKAERELRDAFRSPHGQRILAHMKQMFDGETFDPHPYKAAYKAGRRSAYRIVAQYADAEPAAPPAPEDEN